MSKVSLQLRTMAETSVSSLLIFKCKHTTKGVQCLRNSQADIVFCTAWFPGFDQNFVVNVALYRAD